MVCADADKQAEMPKRAPKVDGRTVEDRERARQADPAHEVEPGDKMKRLMEEVVSRQNMMAAHSRVVRNGGAPGIDGMNVNALMAYCREHWPRIREELLNGRYKPQPVLRVMIPKPGGGERTLGIPTVLDRLIQQSLLQILQPIFDPHFSDASFGFRPKRSAHGAVRRAREHVRAGHRWVVDIDLEKFFDRVNHDVLMARVARRVKDRRVLQLIRRYLQAGMLEGGTVSARRQGTPQGGPLSALLSNILLDEWDRELQRRGHRFVRYADDCNVYVRSKRSGERVLESLTRFLSEKLKLVINRDKSAVGQPWERGFLGYSFTTHREAKLTVWSQSLRRLKDKLRELFRSGRGRSLNRVVNDLVPIIRGWVGYYRLSEVKGLFEVLDKWLRRRLRVILWRQWKRPKTRARRLRELGLSAERAQVSAVNGHGPWWNAGAAHMHLTIPTRYLRSAGLISFLEEHRRLASSS